MDFGEVVFLPEAMRVTGRKVEPGFSTGPGSVVLEGTSTRQVVSLDLDADRQEIVDVGDTVAVTMPDGSDVPGTVAEIGRVASATEDAFGNAGMPTVEVIVTLDDAAAAASLDGAPVTVVVTRSSRPDVLAVPVNALVALLEGGYAVEVVDAGRLDPPRGRRDRHLRRRLGRGQRRRARGGSGRRGAVMTAAVTLTGVTMTYPGAPPVEALKDVDLTIERGELLAILGPSGSGKSTLLHLVGTLDQPTAGSVEVLGRDVSRLDDGRLSAVRASEIGFVFQQFHLLERRDSARERGRRAALPRRARSRATAPPPARRCGASASRRARTTARASSPAVSASAWPSPGPSSAGRAIVLADEPTGNLDTVTGAGILDLLRDLNAVDGTTVVVITHDRDVAARTARQVELRDGRDRARQPPRGGGMTAAGSSRPPPARPSVARCARRRLAARTPPRRPARCPAHRRLRPPLAQAPLDPDRARHRHRRGGHDGGPGHLRVEPGRPPGPARQPGHEPAHGHCRPDLPGRGQQPAGGGDRR